MRNATLRARTAGAPSPTARIKGWGTRYTRTPKTSPKPSGHTCEAVTTQPALTNWLHWAKHCRIPHSFASRNEPADNTSRSKPRSPTPCPTHSSNQPTPNFASSPASPTASATPTTSSPSATSTAAATPQTSPPDPQQHQNNPRMRHKSRFLSPTPNVVVFGWRCGVRRCGSCCFVSVLWSCVHVFVVVSLLS